MAERDDRTLAEMFVTLTRDIRTLIEQEVLLAKTELAERTSKALRGAIFIVGGGLIAHGAVLAVVAAIVLALVAAGLPGWASALLTAVVLAIFGYGLIRVGMSRMKVQELTPHQTIDSLKEDAQWLKSATK